MRRTETLPGVRMIQFLRILSRYGRRRSFSLEAAELSGGWGAHVPARWRKGLEDEGEAVLGFGG